MSDTKKDQIDLIEDITVEELLGDGLIESVEVIGEEDSKQKQNDEKAPQMKMEETTPETAFASVKSAIAAGPGQAQVPQATHVAPVEPAKDPVAEPQAKIDAAIAAAPTAEVPKTKAGLINAVYQHMSKMTTEDLSAMYGKMTAPADQKADDDETAKAAGDDEKKETDDDQKKEVSESDDKFDFAKKDDEKKDDDKGEKKEDDKAEDDKEEDDKEETKEGVMALLASDNTLSEEFKAKATSLFEASVEAKVAKQVETLEQNYQTRLTEEVDAVQTALSEKVDSYLSYVVQEWVESNKVAIEKGLRTEIAEGFIEGLKNLFKENYIEVPEGKENLIDTLNQNVAKLEEQLNQQTQSNMKLNESITALKRQAILAEASKDLASTEAIKLSSLTESIDFEDAESFQEKVESIKESYFRKEVSTSVSPSNEVETAVNEQGEEIELSPIMEVYSSTLSRTVKNP